MLTTLIGAGLVILACVLFTHANLYLELDERRADRYGYSGVVIAFIAVIAVLVVGIGTGWQ